LIWPRRSRRIQLQYRILSQPLSIDKFKTYV
jgi:hypothetical protein